MAKKENRKHKIWVDLSKNDLKTSRILYQNGFYRNSYYFFQQASEKALKALTLKYEFVKEEDLKKFRHDVFKLFELFINKRENELLSTINENTFDSKKSKELGFLRENQTQFSEARRVFYMSTKKEIVSVSIEDLDSMLKEFKKSVFYNLNLPSNYGIKAKQKMAQFLTWLEKSENKASLKFKQWIESLSNNEDDFKYIYESFVKIVKIFIDSVFGGMAIFYCSFITAKHNDLTRYPQEDWNPLKIYSSRLPIIKKQPEFMKLLDRALKNFDLS